MVQKILTIALSFVILMQSAGICASNIIQMDDLVKHIQFHNKKYGDNITTFLSKHYGEKKSEHTEQHQNENEEHNQLPFQHIAHSISLVSLIPNMDKQAFQILDFSDRKKSEFYYQAPFSTVHVRGLIQPPQTT